MSNGVIIQRLDALKLQLDRIERKLSVITVERKKESWAGVSFVQELTGWGAERLRLARDQGLIQWKDDPTKGRLYNLESIPKILIKKPN